MRFTHAGGAIYYKRVVRPEVLKVVNQKHCILLSETIAIPFDEAIEIELRLQPAIHLRKMAFRFSNRTTHSHSGPRRCVEHIYGLHTRVLLRLKLLRAWGNAAAHILNALVAIHVVQLHIGAEILPKEREDNRRVVALYLILIHLPGHRQIEVAAGNFHCPNGYKPIRKRIGGYTPTKPLHALGPNCIYINIHSSEKTP